MGSLSQFEECGDALLRGHSSAGEGVGGIGLVKAVEDADYFLHNLILRDLWRLFGLRLHFDGKPSCLTHGCGPALYPGYRE